ncbi:MAG: methyltransferase [Microbacterium sp.]
MPEFDYSRLRRSPDVEAPNLQAWDATDELLVQAALDASVPGEQIAVIGDGYGAMTLALTDAGLRGIRVHQDLVTGRQALATNSVSLSLTEWSTYELTEDLLDRARLVLVQLPKALAELEEIADAVARWADPDVTLIAGGRVKHMTLAQNEVLSRSFATVQPQRAERKSRLIMASDPRPAPETVPFPITETHDGLTLAAYGGAFAGARLDIGTRALLDAMSTLEVPVVNPHVIDLGCGTGALAAAFARQHPDAVIIATDQSASAVRSARATMTANGLDGRVQVTLDDAGSELPDASADLILLNPPFHPGASVHEGAGQRLIQAAARLLKSGGEVWTVFNSHLDHRRALSRDIGATEQVARTPKFTVTRSIRRG